MTGLTPIEESESTIPSSILLSCFCVFHCINEAQGYASLKHHFS